MEHSCLQPLLSIVIRPPRTDHIGFHRAYIVSDRHASHLGLQIPENPWGQSRVLYSLRQRHHNAVLGRHDVSVETRPIYVLYACPYAHQQPQQICSVFVP